MKFEPADWTTHLFSRHLRLMVLMISAVLASFGGIAQGWQFNFGGEKTDEGWAVLQTEDWGFLVVGFGESFGTNNDQDIFVLRTDVDGTKLWSAYYDEGFQEQARALIRTADGNYLIAGNIIKKIGENENIYLLKINRKGEKIWSKDFGTSGAERVSSVILDQDGGFLVVGSIRKDNGDEDMLLVKFDAQGSLQWSKQYGTTRPDAGTAVATFGNGYVLLGNSRHETGFDNDIVLYRLDNAGNIVWQRQIANNYREEGRDILISKDGGIVLAGLINDNPDAYVAKYSPDGTKLWDKVIGQTGIEEEANAITELNDGSFVLTGLKVLGMVNVDIFVAKLSASGQFLWDKNLGDEEITEEGRDIQATADGGFIITGYNAQVLSAFNDLVLIKTDGGGNIISNYVNGRVFADADNQCDFDASEKPLSGWLVQVEGRDKTYYGTTDKNGYYQILTDTGRYNVRAFPLNRYWEACKPQGVTVQLSGLYDTTFIDFPMKRGISCAFLEVNVATPFLAACQNLEYTVTYCNQGTEAAKDVYIDLSLDSKLTYQGASIPAIQQPDGQYRFLIGSLGSTQCGSFTVKASMACSGIAEGQAALVAARIYPDTNCLSPDPNWDLSSLAVSGDCEGDSLVTFTIRNIGEGNMTASRKSIVTQDDIVLRTIDIKLRSNEEVPIKVPANGSTYRVIVEQSAGHPGKSYPTVAVEGCVTGGQPYKVGKVTMFPEDDFDPFVAINVQEISSAVLPVDLRGYPKGYRDSIIAPETDLTFKVLFSNTSADTIRRIVIRDTLSPYLDPRTLVPGAGNYPYRLEVYANGVVKISLDNIILPPAGSTTPNVGYVEFRVSQKANNPLRSVINNRATVFFDYQKPVATRTIRYVVDKFPDFLEVITSQREVFLPGVEVLVFPNPFSESVRFEVKGRTFNQLQLSIYSLEGKLLQQHEYNDNFFYVYRNQLSSGLYLYRLESKGQLINSGKLLVR